MMLVQLCFSQDYLARARSGKEWGYVNKKGDYIVNPQFEKPGIL